MKPQTTGDYHFTFYHVIFITIIYAMTLPVGGHYGMNILVDVMPFVVSI